ncbi:hypothetical protein ACFVVU_17015 [Kitasatospora sp. NPDC057965]|uniref:hypothetical protein n=1 Tax=Kitasatospora sp. NPDC057965 TaxID=3346291 RepID=UPI0036D8F087
MEPDWDHAHTTAPAANQTPRGLAESEADWRRRLEQTPNGHLLRDNAMLRSLASGAPVHLLHLTRSLDAVRSSGQLLASTGCLVGAVYGSPLTPAPGGALRPHNLGTHLLASRDTLNSRRGSTPLVIEITPDRAGPAVGLDYVRLGPVHLRAYEAQRHVLTPAEHEHVVRSVTDRVAVAAPFLDALLHNSGGRPSPDRPFIDALAAAVPILPYLGYLYFETVAEYLMLHSTSPATKEFAARGEMNNRLYKDLAFSAVTGMDTLFDLGRFHPGHGRLLDLVGRIEPALAAGAPAYIRRRLSHTFATTCLASGQDTTAVTPTPRSGDRASTLAGRRSDWLVARQGLPQQVGLHLGRLERGLGVDRLGRAGEAAAPTDPFPPLHRPGAAAPAVPHGSGTAGPSGEVPGRPGVPWSAGQRPMSVSHRPGVRAVTPSSF